MRSVTASDICSATGGTLSTGSGTCVFSGISTDTRTVRKGELFIPLIGENHDGHDYIAAAIDKGASGVLTSCKDTLLPAGASVMITVPDTLKALGDIAAWRRAASKAKIVAVTGSVGKTSTKDMTAAVLSARYRVLKNEGNLNNQIGMPMTLLKLDDTHDYAVVEMGMSSLGEISRLSRIARPDISVISNIGISHIEKLGSRQNILKAKLEIMEGMNDEGLLILNGDDPLLPGVKGLTKQKTLFFGINGDYDFTAHDITSMGGDGMSFKLTCESGCYDFVIRYPGIHNIYNALAAIAVGICAGMEPEKVACGLDAYVPHAMRLNIITKGSLKIIDDTYNASPQSMVAALDVLSELGGASRKIAVLGDMLEMGEWAMEAHRETGRHAVSRNMDWIITIGEMSRYIAIGAVEAGFEAERILVVSDRQSACRLLEGLVKPGDAILVKGSRGMRLENIVDYLLNKMPERE